MGFSARCFPSGEHWSITGATSIGENVIEARKIKPRKSHEDGRETCDAKIKYCLSDRILDKTGKAILKGNCPVKIKKGEPHSSPDKDTPGRPRIIAYTSAIWHYLRRRR